ncbi:MAG: recombinase family protein [Blautia sp.]|nr:recombinase family protein [Blautia sp.]
MRKITRLEPAAPVLKPKKRVAAYARVSLETERLQHSLSAQISYYNEKIQKNPDWLFAGVYADNGISGTGTARRDEFNRLLADCEAGKIDIVLAKSISRFARNTVDLLETVRHLKEIGVEVWFERENIHSMSGDGELMLSILASFAQEESRNISENIKWSYQKKMENGTAINCFRVLGYRWEERQLVVEPDEARTVQRIYREFLSGRTPKQIMRGLNADGVKTVNGKAFCMTSVKRILRNSIYTGELILQKYYIDDPITKVQKRNCGELPMYRIPDDHEAIISPETFSAVQEEIRHRLEEWTANEHMYEGIRDFSRLVKCSKAEATFVHETGEGGYGGDGAWACHHYDCPHRNECSIRRIPDLALRQSGRRALQSDTPDGDQIRASIEKIMVPKDGILIFHMKNGSIYEDCFRAATEPVEKQGKIGNCFTKRLKCGCCGNYFNAHSYYGRRKIRLVQWNCHHCGENSYINENVLKYRIKDACGWDEFSPERCKEEIDVVEMDRPCHMIIRMNDGRVFAVDYYAEKKRRTKYGQTGDKDTCDDQPADKSAD